jgi:hypothetical protein
MAQWEEYYVDMMELTEIWEGEKNEEWLNICKDVKLHETKWKDWFFNTRV